MNDACASLDIWVIYDHPIDIPDWFVARRQSIGPDGQIVIARDYYRHEHLEGLRRMFEERGLHCLKRHSGDDPKVVECWL